VAVSALASIRGLRQAFAQSVLPAASAVRVPIPDVTGRHSLKAHAAAQGLLYGCAVDSGLLERDEGYRKLIIEQCSIVVAENAMKWGPLRPTIDTFDWVQADALVDFAHRHGMKVRGHNLCWHQQLPSWFLTQAKPANARKLLEAHIAAVAGRYAGKMHSWDVVNEAVQISDQRPDGLRVWPWLQLLGPEYIEIAFRAARKADPTALLTYNDFGIEGEDENSAKKRAAVLALVRRLHAAKVPIDAVGIQSHINAGAPYGASLLAFMHTLRGLGLQVFITEMDVNDGDWPAEVTERDRRVAQTYYSYLRAALTEPALKCVLTWGITDRATWLNTFEPRQDHLPQRCLPFGERNALPDQPKAAFFSARLAFDQRGPVATLPPAL
jgi:endo-1,4-beta-xylanase